MLHLSDTFIQFLHKLVLKWDQIFTKIPNINKNNISKAVKHSHCSLEVIPQLLYWVEIFALIGIISGRVCVSEAIMDQSQQRSPNNRSLVQ